MRPFENFGLKPFLYADEAARAEIQREFLRLSREVHPDRFVNASDEEREQAEARSAALNADYAVLKDPFKLIDRVLADTAPAGAAEIQKVAMPPMLAAEYFELQELWLENRNDPTLAPRMRELKDEVASGLAQNEQAVMALAQPFAYAGKGPSNSPTWTQEDLAKLRSAVHKLRYFRSFARDIEAKFSGSR